MALKMKLNTIRYYFNVLSFVFFLAYIATFPLQRRHIFNINSFTTTNPFNEWLTISLYPSDIFLSISIVCALPLIISWVKKNDNKTLFSLLSSIVLISLFSIYGRSQFFSQIELYRLFVLVLGISSLVLLSIFSSRRKRIAILYTLLLSGVFQTIIGIIQFAKQQSIGLKVLGEISFSPQFENIAEIVSEGTQYIRPVGTFPHANVFGMFLVLTYISALLLHIYTRTLVPQALSTRIKIHQYLSYAIHINKSIQAAFTYSIYVFQAIVSIGIIFSFSRIAYISLCFTLLVWFIYCKKHLLWRTNRTVVYAHLCTLVVAVLVLLPLIVPRGTIPVGSYDVAERISGNTLAFEMIKSTFPDSIGIGGYTAKIMEIYPALEAWQYQPAHNVFLLILAEIGFTGFVLFIALLILTYNQLFSKNLHIKIYTLMICIPLILGMMFDHYFWTLHPGVSMFWIFIAFAQLVPKNEPK